MLGYVHHFSSLSLISHTCSLQRLKSKGLRDHLVNVQSSDQLGFFAKVLNVSSQNNVVRLAVDVQKENYHLMDLDSFPVIELVGVQRLNL